MVFYRLLRPLIFALEPEVAHAVTFFILDNLNKLKLIKNTVKNNPVNIMGIKFPNRVGVAAGLDKNGDHIPALFSLGFGFVEIGTLTPKAQAGNKKPRLFRLKKDKALINRMGFNNKGIDQFLTNMRKIKKQGVLGVNIGKNKITPNDKAIDDYLFGLEAVYPYADYITINISSPNTENLRDLQADEPLTELLSTLKNKQAELSLRHKQYVPLVVKIAPDLTSAQIRSMATIFIHHKIDGIIVTNTTITRPDLKSKQGNEAGGLSGAPLKALANSTLKTLHDALKDKIPLIASGGILTPSDAAEKLKHGACLVQLYTGLIYQGPGLIKKITKEISSIPAS